ncbi:MAG: hypothetical protein II008_04250 [Oscillospiraceae bacterium]|nr:hypothetical protein [Oscillospiraceae bacterium]
MKKLLSLLLILALALPALALAESSEPLYVNKHYAMHLDSHENGFASGKGGRIFTFDSYTLDLYLMTDQKTGYLLETTCIDGVFLSSGTMEVKMVDFNGTLRIIYSGGNYLTAEWDENGEDLWITLDRGTFRMRPIEIINASNDWR